MARALICNKVFASITGIDFVAENTIDLICKVTDAQMFLSALQGSLDISTLEVERGKTVSLSFGMIDLFLALDGVQVTLLEENPEEIIISKKFKRECRIRVSLKQ